MTYVTGICRENPTANTTDRLAISDGNRASPTGASGGAAGVVDVRNSTIAITRLTFDG
jgi:hypothetical protein